METPADAALPGKTLIWGSLKSFLPTVLLRVKKGETYSESKVITLELQSTACTTIHPAGVNRPIAHGGGIHISRMPMAELT